MNKKLSILMLLLLFFLTSCVYQNDAPQSVFHENVDGLEHYVIDELGDYIVFSPPAIYENNLTWVITFRRSYIENGNLMENTPPTVIMENVRTMINEFSSEHRDCLINSCKTTINFYLPSAGITDVGAEQESVGTILNYNSHNSEEQYSGLCAVIYPDDYSLDCLKGSDSIFQIELPDSSIEDILEIIDSLPNLQTVYVSDGIKEELTGLRPDINIR